MKNRSRVFSLFSYTFLFLGLSLLLQPMLTFEFHHFDLAELWEKVSLFHGVVFALCLFSACLAWNASSGFVYVGVLSLSGVFLLNLFANTSFKEVPREMWLGNAALVSIFLFSLKRNIREVLFDPSKRWWLTHPRRALCVRTVLSTWSNEKIFGISENLSRNGIFVELSTAQSAELNALKKLAVGKMLHLKLDVGPLYVLHLQAQVVRKVINPTLSRQGLGLRFVGLSNFERRQISEVLSQSENF